MCLHACEDTCGKVLISSFGNFELFVVLLSPCVLMDPRHSLFKIRFRKTHSKQQTDFYFDINVKLKSIRSGKLVCIGLQLMQLVDEVMHDIMMNQQNQGLSYLRKPKTTQT